MKRLLVVILLGVSCAFAQNDREKDQTPSTINTGAAISVTVGGAFPLNGTFEASPLERVDQFVTRVVMLARARQLSSGYSPGLGEDAMDRMADPFARRNIRLKRMSGDDQVVDLERFRLTGDFKYNPYLKSDDVLVFPAIDREREFVSISGAVNKTIRFQFVPGDRLADAILFAGGLNPSYDSVSHAEISRLDTKGAHENLLRVSIADNPVLERGDRIAIRVPNSEKKDFRVFVTGEVNFPGSVPITKDSTTLREVLRRVGGFKPTADLSRAELLRGTNVYQSLLFTPEFERMLMTRMAVISWEDTLSFSIDNALRLSRGSGQIDFTKVMNDSSQEGKFLVRDMDHVFIPQKVTLVYVYGQVNNPGYIPYREGEQVAYYLEKAGGVAESAKGTIYLIKGKSRSWVEVENVHHADVEAGDFLWVPKRLPRDFDYYLLRIGSIASIIAAFATVIAVIQRL
jgi:polysaccharide biosynthesis/export protein